MMLDLNGTTAIVTGGGGGIGEAIVRALAGSGASVALHFNVNESSARRIAEELGERVKAFRADFSRPAEAAGLFDEAVGEFGAVDLLVNNAGLALPAPPEMACARWLEIWKRTIDVNLTATAALCYKAINHFRERGGGRIVHIASRAAFRGETEEYLAYAASKGGMVSLSRSIARSFGSDSIKSFVIAPGFVRTKMMDQFLEEHPGMDLVGETALGELTTTADIAPIVVFIASGKLDHATGCTIDINAGSYMR